MTIVEQLQRNAVKHKKKHPPLDQRVASLERELHKLKADMKRNKLTERVALLEQKIL